MNITNLILKAQLTLPYPHPPITHQLSNLQMRASIQGKLSLFIEIVSDARAKIGISNIKYMIKINTWSFLSTFVLCYDLTLISSPYKTALPTILPNTVSDNSKSLSGLSHTPWHHPSLSMVFIYSLAYPMHSIFVFYLECNHFSPCPLLPS